MSKPSQLVLAGMVFHTIDLTQELSASTPMFDATESSLIYRTLTTVSADGYGTGEFHMAEHCGTHMDAPSHFCEGALSIDQIPVENLILPAVVIDVREQCQSDSDYTLTMDEVSAFEKLHSITPRSAILLLTGWSSRFGNPEAYRNADKNGTKHFPGFGAEAVEYLIENHHATAFGIDTLSADCGLSEDFKVHNCALSKNVLLVENLVNLEQLPPVGATIFFAPIKLKNGTGSPLRVIGLTPQS